MNELSPKYIQIYDTLRNDIILQHYSTGAFLPTEKQLMERYDAGRSTVRHALSMLQEDGFINTVHGSGSVVLPVQSKSKGTKLNINYKNFDIEYHVESPDIRTSSAAVETVPAPDDVAAALEIEPGTLVYCIQKIWALDDKPHNYMIMYINRNLLPGFRKYADGGENLYKVVREKYNLHFLRGEEHITARNAEFVEANLLHLNVGDAILYTTRTAYCEKGAFEYAIFYGNPKYTGYKVEL